MSASAAFCRPLFPLRYACRAAAWLIGAGALLACSPTFNWRDVTLEGTALQAQMPCKPDRAERQVPLNDAGVLLRMASCETGGVTFVLAWAALAPGEAAGPVLDRWQQAAWASLRQTVSPPALAPVGWQASAQAVRGASEVRAWQGPGQDHRGAALVARHVYLAHGGWVYQAAVYGQRWSPDSVAPFFDALRLPTTP